MDTPGQSSVDGRRLRHLPPRRAVLAGGLAATAALVTAAVGVERGDLPGRPWLSSHLGLNGPPGRLPDVTPGPMVSGTLTSGPGSGPAVAGPSPGRPAPTAACRCWSSCTVAAPTTGRPWAATSASSASSPGPSPRARRPFAIASVDGGDTYWHHRSSGEDAGAMVTDESCRC